MKLLFTLWRRLFKRRKKEVPAVPFTGGRLVRGNAKL